MNKAYKSVDAAEQAFYDAFASGDMDTMTAVWSENKDICCVHPMSQELTDRDSVLTSWSEIFSHAPEIEIEIEVQKRVEYGDITVSIVHEHLSVPNDKQIHPPIIATNIYQNTDGDWRLISHHSSPTPRAKAASDEDEDEPTVH